MKQNSLFALTAKKKTETKAPVLVKEEKVAKEKVAEEPVRHIGVPKEGDTVILLNINNGIEAVVDYVDSKNLYKDYFYPIQCHVPSLNNMMIRSELKNCILKK
jgi:hypothetical protein